MTIKIKKQKISKDDKYTSLSKKGQYRYQKIIEAATEVFLEQGFINASMNEIVKRAGGSLTTLYKIFENKNRLFTEVLQTQSEELINSFDFDESDKDDDLEIVLYNIATSYIKAITREKALSFYRLFVVEGYKNGSEAGKIFLSTYNDITQKIANFIDKKNIFVGDSQLAAYQFLQIVAEPTFVYYALDLKEFINDEMIEKNIRQAISIFINGIQNKLR